MDVHRGSASRIRGERPVFAVPERGDLGLYSKFATGISVEMAAVNQGFSRAGHVR